MPLTRITIREGRDASDVLAIQDSIYEAMRAVFNVPEDDRFMVVDEKPAYAFTFGATYMDIQRGDGLVMIQITASDTRTMADKRALYREITERLGRNPGVRPEDVMISLVEAKPENWSFGHGLAQYAMD